MPLKLSPRANRFMKLGTSAREFASRVPRYEEEAAELATATSRMVYGRWHSGRPNPPPRPGRPTTMGAFASLLKWAPNGAGAVRLDVAELNEKAPYWLIQEIGTGQTAVMWDRKGVGVTVRSQIGRRLPRGFFWADEGGVSPTKNTAEKYRSIPAPFRSPGRQVAQGVPLIGQQNLFPMSMAPPGAMVRAARGRIHREIIGKHFVRDGGIEGFNQFSEALTVDYRKVFR